MKNDLNTIQLRSDEVKDILTKVPHTIIRFGSALILILLLLLLLMSWVIEYPDIIAAEAVITSQSPPQKEHAQTSGKIDSIYVIDAQNVSKNTVLAVIKNPANTADVYYLKSILDTIKIKNQRLDFPINEVPILALGNIETAYANFENNYLEYELNKTLKPFQNDEIANQIALSELKTALRNLQTQFNLNKSALKIKKNDFERSKILLTKGVISRLDYEKNQIEVLNAERELKGLATSISKTRQAIGDANKNSNSTQIIKTKEGAKLARNLIQSFNQLKKAILDWESKFVLKSEIDGKVSFLNYWSSNQHIQQGDVVFSVVPRIKGEYIAKLKAKPQNSGKIKVGQHVNIKLQNYPNTEFGSLEGRITSVSLTVDKDGFYVINATLPKNLTTSYNRKIEFKQEMNGMAEIVTEDIRLLQRFFHQLNSLISKKN